LDFLQNGQKAGLRDDENVDYADVAMAGNR
jgi:hypothetical protein